MRLFTKFLLTALIAAPAGWPPARAAEFEVLDRFSVDGYSVFRGSADIPGGSFAVGGSSFIVTGGSVGIGTAGPNARLTVWTPGAAGTQQGVRVNNPAGFDTAGTGPSIIFSQDRSAAEDYQMANIFSGNAYAASSVAGYLGFGTRSGSANPAERMRITGAGSVGIGTTAPQSLLHISGGTPAFTIDNTAHVVTSRLAFRNTVAGRASGSAWEIQSILNDGGGLSTDYEIGDLAFAGLSSTGSGTLSERMRLTKAGNVGIGTTNPGKTLDVNGNIGFTSLKPSGVANAHISYFNTSRTTTGVIETQNLYKIDPSAVPFSEGIIEVTYGTRIQGVSDAVTGVVKKLFGYNKFNSGQVAVTAATVLAEDANSAAHISIAAAVVGSGASAYIVLRLTFSASATSSSFAWGEVKIFELESGVVITKLI